jgi:hypothetical protein
MTATRDSADGDKPQRQDNFKLISELLEAVQSDQTLQQPGWNSYGQSVPQKTKLYMISGFVQRANVDDKMIYNSCP